MLVTDRVYLRTCKSLSAFFHFNISSITEVICEESPVSTVRASVQVIGENFIEQWGSFPRCNNETIYKMIVRNASPRKKFQVNWKSDRVTRLLQDRSSI